MGESESFVKNILFQTYCKTARGGAGNAGLGSKNRLLPIAKWLQRRLVFSCGFQHEDILKYISNKKSQHVDEQDSSDVHDVL